MSKFLAYEPCPKCREIGRDNRGDNCGVYSDGSKHCFAGCGYHIFPKHYSPQEEVKHVSAVLPSDFTREVPSRALSWLLQFGLPYSYWRNLIGWSEKDSRLVFTPSSAFSIGRYIAASTEAQLALPRVPRKWFVYGACHSTADIVGAYEEAKEIVLVEDLISAHKLASCGVPAVCLYGTSVFPACFPVLRFVGLPVVLWLDKDQEHTLAKKSSWLSALTGLNVRYVVTDNDPKTLSLQQVNKVLDKKG